VTISNGDITVAADRAEATGTELNFQNNRWVFTGKVHVKTENQGELHSDKATVEFSNNLLTRAVVVGAPAEFVQTQSTTGKLVRGHAGSIDYEVAQGTVRLSDDAWLTYDGNEMSGPELIYNVRQKQVQGETNPTKGGRVHITVVPKPDASKDSKP
jgi:lipopolysaccharide export system protein LptA